MSSKTQVLIVNNIKLPLNASIQEAFSIAKERLIKAGISRTDLKFSVYKRSVDARNKSDVHFVYSVLVSGIIGKLNETRLAKCGVSVSLNSDLEIPECGTEPTSAPPLVVGSGPAGLFCSLLLAERGYKPTLIERGGSIKERQNSVRIFNELGILDKESNIQFGAGGAGTFSDGKLVTRINDPLTSYIFARLVEFGAPEEILYSARPHVGTDVLSVVVDNILDRISSLGGTVLYNTKYVTTERCGEDYVAKTTNGDIRYGSLILAIGHSARDTYERIISDGYALEAKAISVGMRIEHKCRDIDTALYGDFAGHPALGHAEYNLSHNTKVRGVYTFCMCPGGEVVGAASEEGGVVVNGMSHHARNGENSNCAVVCSIFKEDYGASPMGAIEFQRKIERGAFVAGGSDYNAPIITVGDFLKDECSKEPYYVTPTYRGGNHVRLASPKEYLPEVVTSAISDALLSFDKKIKGFAASGAVLTGAETRTSAPVRILRDPITRLASGKGNVYPIGEGAGYAGGITSAAIDGVKTAISIIARYKP
ncbi:MAG: hypothetical protein J6Q69_01085 [Clostridia bacterium]|nr:hypothetical protein [Clostridia bacterium]